MMKRPVLSQALGLAGWLVIAFVAAGLGAIASMDAPAFYAQLVRPGWAPQASLFGPVWTVLYVLMGVAAWLVWLRGPAREVTGALTLFIVQLVVNALWSWLFFIWRLGALAFADVLVLLVLIVMTIAAFWRLRCLAALLMIPYLAWVGFASVLTWSVWRSNPSLL